MDEKTKMSWLASWELFTLESNRDQSLRVKLKHDPTQAQQKQALADQAGTHCCLLCDQPNKNHLLSPHMRSILIGSQYAGVNYFLNKPTEHSSTVKSLQKCHLGSLYVRGSEQQVNVKAKALRILS